MARTPRHPAARGMTLLELLFVVAISGVVITGITKVVIDVLRTNQARQLTADVQGEGRDSLSRVERAIRLASLGSTLGSIWTQNAAGVVQVPAVQIYDNVTATSANAMGGRRVKPDTDAILVVAARVGGAQAQVWTSGGSNYDSTGNLYLTDGSGFTGRGADTVHVLVGPYLAAGWGKVTDVVAAVSPRPIALQISSGTINMNVYPGGRVDPGAMVREARARLYFVNDHDELVSVRLAFPFAPTAAAHLLDYEVHATGVENLQVECEVDAGNAFGACPAAVADGGANWALGTGTRSRVGVGGPDGRVNVGLLRTIILSVVVRSPRPVRDQQFDQPIAIGNSPALAALAYDERGNAYQLAARDGFLRRAYRMPVAIRNVSLGAY